MVERDLETGKYGGRVATRFPPEPNGYPHIGHAKSICLNFGVAEQYGGTCNLRFDDTNPGDRGSGVRHRDRGVTSAGSASTGASGAYFASDYFELLYQHAVQLIETGKAYVDSLSEEEIREYRGTVTEPGATAPTATAAVEENLDPSAPHAGRRVPRRRPRAARQDRHDGGEHEDARSAPLPDQARVTTTGPATNGASTRCTTSPTASRTPIEGITHSLCTLEFENNRDIYDWVLDHTSPSSATGPSRPSSPASNLTYTVLSKRKLLELVEKGLVSGWDDPRMPTLRGYRRRGYTPEAIPSLLRCASGVSKANSVVDVAQLEHAIRDDLNPKVRPRVLCVTRPLKVVIDELPGGRDRGARRGPTTRTTSASSRARRKLPFSRELWIESEATSPRSLRRASAG